MKSTRRWWRQWPAVTHHLATGVRILFVNPMHAHGFEGVTQEEAWPLIDELTAIATDDRFVYHHHWRVGDVLMWDESRGRGGGTQEDQSEGADELSRQRFVNPFISPVLGFGDLAGAETASFTGTEGGLACSTECASVP